MRTSVPIGASILFLSITALALAADDPLMKQAQGLFQPIPFGTACDQGHHRDASNGGARKGSLFRSAPVAEPQYQLQHLSSDWARWRGHVARVDRAQMAEGWAQRTHGAERRFQRGAVLGWARRRLEGASWWSHPKSHRDGNNPRACHRNAQEHSGLCAIV